MKDLSKSILLFALLIGFIQQGTAQDSRQLLSSTTKTFKIHFGIEGGVGANYLFSDLTQNMYFIEKAEDNYVAANYKMRLAPRPEAQFGLFSEIEFKRWDLKVYTGYLGQTVPKPIRTMTASDVQYNLAYMHNFTANAMLYYKPSARIRVGLGLESHMGFVGEKRGNSELGEYWYGLSHFSGLRAEVGYQVNPRMHVNTYAMVGKYAAFTGAVVDNVSAGVTISYRLKGKEYEIKKDIYKINYEAEVLPKAPKGIGH